MLSSPTALMSSPISALAFREHKIILSEVLWPSPEQTGIFPNHGPQNTQRCWLFQSFSAQLVACISRIRAQKDQEDKQNMALGSGWGFQRQNLRDGEEERMFLFPWALLKGLDLIAAEKD